MPAPFRVIWTLRAERDLAGIRDYVATESPTAADRLANRLFQAGRRLSDFPDVGRLEGVTRVLTTVPPYLIRYRVQREGVVIVGVRHGGRRP
ncbi:type II toxin-antitoxin system RelE/ParE family toxin [Caulobacter sp. S45]|uniref:type II toxin-antitoxin system RelE/ParE family toxin n=1 Tax=Caulobacter sp. S45 TaxID=1641861 RepID=UPI00157627F3|nr:type II toxin-antitoxin system RelE/ParE family toxin [Caulobacter sp. S45]